MYTLLKIGWAAAKAGTLLSTTSVKAVVKASLSILKAAATKAAITIATKVAAFLSNPVVGAILTLVDIIMFGIDIYNIMAEAGKSIGRIRYGPDGKVEEVVRGFTDKVTGQYILYDDYDKVFAVSDTSNVQFEETSGGVAEIENGIIEEPVYTRVTQGADNPMFMHITQLADSTKEAFTKVLEVARKVVAHHPSFPPLITPLENTLSTWRYKDAALQNDTPYIQAVLETFATSVVEMALKFSPLEAPEFESLALFLEGDQLFSMGFIQLANLTINWLDSVNDHFIMLKDTFEEFGTIFYYLRAAGDFVQPHGVNWPIFVVYDTYYSKGYIMDKLFTDWTQVNSAVNEMLAKASDSINHYRPLLPSVMYTALSVAQAELQPMGSLDIRQVQYKTSTLNTVIKLYYEKDTDTGYLPTQLMQNMYGAYEVMLENDRKVNALKVEMGEAATPVPTPPSYDDSITSANLQQYVNGTEQVLLNTRNFAREVGIATSFETNVVFTKQLQLTEPITFINSLIADITNVSSLQFTILQQGERDIQQLEDVLEVFYSGILVLQSTLAQFSKTFPEIDLTVGQFTLSNSKAFLSVEEYKVFTNACINLYLDLTDDICARYSIIPKAIELLSPDANLSNRLMVIQMLTNQCYELASFMRYISQEYKIVEVSRQVLAVLVKEIENFNSSVIELGDEVDLQVLHVPTTSEMDAGIYPAEDLVKIVSNGEYIMQRVRDVDTAELGSLIAAYFEETEYLSLLAAAAQILRAANTLLYVLVFSNSSDRINALVNLYLKCATAYNTLGSLFEIKSTVFAPVYANFPVWFSIARDLTYATSQASKQEDYLKPFDDKYKDVPLGAGVGDVYGYGDYTQYYNKIREIQAEYTNATDTGIIPDASTPYTTNTWNYYSTPIDNVRKVIRLNDTVNFMGLRIGTIMIEQRITGFTFPAYMFTKQWIPQGIDSGTIDWKSAGYYLKTLLSSIETNLGLVIPAIRDIGLEESRKWDILRTMGYVYTPFGLVKAGTPQAFANETATPTLTAYRESQKEKYDAWTANAVQEIRASITNTPTSIWGAHKKNDTRYSEGLYYSTYLQVIQENLAVKSVEQVSQDAANGVIDEQVFTRING